jgi:vacuolar-type H+-ATPase subunit I/STV1
VQNEERMSELMQLKNHETEQKSMYNRTKKVGTSVWNTGSFVFDSVNRLNDLANNPIIGPLIAKQMEGLQNSIASNKESNEESLNELTSKESQTPQEIQENQEKLKQLQERQEQYNALIKESDDTAKKLNVFKDKKRLTKKDLNEIKNLTEHLNEIISEIKNFNNIIEFGKQRFGKRKTKKSKFGNKKEDPIIKLNNKDITEIVKVIKQDPKTELSIKKFLYKTLKKIGIKLGDYVDYTLKKLIEITLNYLGLMFTISVLYNYYIL